MSTNLHKKMFQTLKKKRKKSFLGRCWAKIGLRKAQPSVWFQSREIPSPRQTSIDKTNDCVTKSERGALVRGSDPPSGHSVHNTAGGVWRAPARRLIQNTFGRWCVESRRLKFSIPFRWQKMNFFSGFKKVRRTPRAISRLLDHGSAWYFRGRHLHSLALPDTKRAGRGLILCRDRRSIVP